MDHNTRSIGDLVKAFLKAKGLEDKMETIDLKENWEKLAGTVIARHTRSLQLKGQILTISLNSAALRHTLSFSKTEFMEKLNEGLGKEMIRDIVLK